MATKSKVSKAVPVEIVKGPGPAIVPPEPPSPIDITPAPKPGPGGKPVSPPMPKDPQLEAVVAEINGVYVRGALETALSMATIVIEQLLGGDERRLARGDKDPLLARLAEHPELRMPPITLWRALAVFQQYRLLPPKLALQLPLSHHQLLLGVPETRAKTTFARRAVEQDFSKRKLEEAVRRWRANQKLPPLGRPPVDPALAGVRGMATAALRVVRALEEKPPTHTDRKEIVSTLSLVEKRLNRIHRALERA